MYCKIIEEENQIDNDNSFILQGNCSSSKMEDDHSKDIVQFCLGSELFGFTFVYTHEEFYILE